ncbi:MAG: class I SAM-dependent methyltransferase [Balneolales bacterium]|nr:class I SAM-dependent methyltransferase [Balneolales bacterium]
MKHLITHTSLTREQLRSVDQLLADHKKPLDDYARLLYWWNQKLNLVSRGVSHETIMEHIRHSLMISVSDYFREQHKIIDTGSGGGLPGIPLAICFPEKSFLINDIVSKKIMAVKNMVQRLELANVETNSASIENVDVSETDLIITKHAFKVDQLIGYLEEKNWQRIIFLKGREEAKEEIERSSVSLYARIIRLDEQLKNSFYQGKAVLEVRRNHE